MRKRYRIAVVIETLAEHGRAVVRGVTSYAERRPSWEMFWLPLGQNNMAILKDAARADGLITRIWNDPLAQMLREARIPVVAVHYWGTQPLPAVGSNSAKVAGMAMEHLVSQGFAHFGFFGATRPFSEARYQPFAALLAKRGFECHSCFAGQVTAGHYNWHSRNRAVERWLKSLPRPIGILAANDTTAHQLLLNARRMGFRVPDEIAVVGVDNDEMLCRMASPPLTSIDPGGEHIGYRAAAMLDRLLKGKHVPPRQVLINPVGLIVRQSSDVLAISDKNVATAVRFIRQNLSRNLNVDDVVDEVTIARRTLEQAFRKSLGRSIHDEIAQSRIRLARQMLLKSDHRMLEIAKACGFRDRTHLSTAFRKDIGVSPSSFRRKLRSPK